MANTLRAMRVVRNELKKHLQSKPEIHGTFATPAERDTYLTDLEIYVNTLLSARDSFHELYKTLLTMTGQDPTSQKTIDDYVDSDTAFLMEVDAYISKLSTILKTLHTRKANERPAGTGDRHDESFHSATSDRTTVKLPTLELKRFSGNTMYWQEFWDSFESAVHTNGALSHVDKFNYLRSQLSGEARSAIGGLALTNDNYETAVQILKRRFGDVQLVINSHYSALTNLAPAADRAEQIRAVVDSLEKHLRSLEALEQDTKHPQFISMIFSKLPREFICRLEEHRGTEAWTVDTLRQKVQTLLTARELADCHLQPSHNSKSRQHEIPKRTEYRPNTTSTLTSNARGTNVSGHPKCHFCQKAHWSDECRTLSTLEARKNQMRGHCFLCLRKGHSARDCRGDKACVHCQQRKSHHRSLCPRLFVAATGPVRTDAAHSVTENRPDDTDPNDSSITHNHLASERVLLTSEERGLLQTAFTTVSTVPSKHSSVARLLLDSGSQRTYVTRALVERLKVQATAQETLSVYTFGSTTPCQIDSQLVKIRVNLLEGKSFELTANVVPNINESVQRAPFDLKKFGALYGSLPLADTGEHSDEYNSIDILIGNDYYWDIVTAERIELSPGLYLIGSKLGWLLGGRVKEPVQWRNQPSMTMLTSVRSRQLVKLPFVTADPELIDNLDLSDWWNLETIGIKDRPDESDDDKALANFNDTVQYHNQRYYVTWPWKDNVENLPTNYQLSLGRLNSLLRRFKDNSELMIKYNDIIQTQLEKGIIEPVDETLRADSKKHYIPHHPVVTPEKSTTKVRIVYDGSAKSKRDNPSINECLYRGPVILEDLCDLLIRFRFHKVALIADIEKAFLQVGLQEQERDVTRFLWLKDPTRFTAENNLQTYRFTKVPFGIISSPFLLGATVMHHLLREDGEVAKRIAPNIYVDNLITGAVSPEDAIHFYTETKRIFYAASMNIREWLSNSTYVMKAIPEADRMSTALTTVLGIRWDSQKDMLHIASSEPDLSDHVTKRTVLKYLSSIFDPLGLFCPALLPAKIFLQTLWSDKMDWDQVLSPEQTAYWKELSVQLAQISSVSLPRYIGPESGALTGTQFTLHCFCDASGRAYGTCVYVRIQTGTSVTVYLVFGKTRVAPKRQITLPRLELLAATVGNRCLQFVEKALGFPVSGKYLWMDSQCVMHWIRSQKPLSVFVSNRIRELRASTNVTYRYVSTTCNPADMASRGIPLTELRDSALWWHGPEWLTLPESDWPRGDALLNFTSETVARIASEIKPAVLYDTSLFAGEPSREEVTSPYGIDITRFSNLTKLLRVTALCSRFLERIRSKSRSKEGSTLSAKDLTRAKLMWIRATQKRHFGDVLASHGKGNRHPLKEALGLWLDENGIIRCKGRLANADLNEHTAFPILIPKRDYFTTLVIKSYHEKFLHTGVAHTLSQIRQEFWIPAGRSEVYKCIQKCYQCRR